MARENPLKSRKLFKKDFQFSNALLSMPQLEYPTTVEYGRDLRVVV